MLGKVGDREGEVQASRYRTNKSRGKAQHRECREWYYNSVVWGQMSATLAGSTAERIDLLNHHVVHLKVV